MTPDASRWRSSADYAYLDDLIASDLAWECLRRNPAYQHDYAQIAGRGPGVKQASQRLRLRWGCDFPVHPAQSGRTVPVFWAPEADLATVILVPSPLASDVPFSGLIAADQRRARSDAAGRCLALGDGAGAIHLALLGPARPGRPLAVIVPLDADLPARMAAAADLWGLLSAGNRPRGLTAQKRRRLTQMLRAVDGRRCGAAHREIAAALFGAARVAGDPWKSSSLRDATLRLVRDGQRMVDGGYRGLLRPQRLSR